MSNSIDQFKLNPLIEKRRSTVSFSDKPVEGQKIHLLFEAARWAPSSYNEQPWRFIYGVKDDENSYEKLFDCLMEGNKEWVKNAPMIILSVAKQDFTLNGNPNFYARHDVGLATENLMIQAVQMGLMVHPMGGFDKKKATAELAIPEGFEPVAMIAVGYPGELNELPENLKKREEGERVRKAQDEFVFRGQWR
jgi:nitroreductase